MKYSQKLRLGSSLSFTRKIDREVLHAMKAVGITAAELSFGFNYYMNTVDFPNNWEKYAVMAEDEGVELWSVHLPFSGVLDISNPFKELRDITLYTNRTLIEAAGKAGIKVAVLHPSSEPIDSDMRPEQLELSKEAIVLLREQCDKAGMFLAVENLPRTCLCNRSGEMIELLKDTGAGVVFDTNHSLSETNTDFLSALIESGLPIHSLHISDYDFIDERHRLPGDGINDWNALLAILEKAQYGGPLMYEVSRQPKGRDIITLEQLAENMRLLAAGKL